MKLIDNKTAFLMLIGLVASDGRGEPFLDISLTAVFDEASETAYITSPLADDTEGMMEFLRNSCAKYPEVSGGFEIDTVRWNDRKLQPAKVYMLIKAGEIHNQ